MTESITTFLSWWAIIGYFLVLVIPRPKTKKQAAIMIAMCGPAAWIFVAVFGIVRLFSNAAGSLSDEGAGGPNE